VNSDGFPNQSGRAAMNRPGLISRLLRVPRLTRRRIGLALAIAVVADGLQLLLGPLGWVFFDEVIDGIAMIATSWLLGFHLLLLPTFAVEFIPVIDLLPTWTGCVGLLIAMRKREQATQPPPLPPPRRLIES
jgi:hypothetical protein